MKGIVWLKTIITNDICRGVIFIALLSVCLYFYNQVVGLAQTKYWGPNTEQQIVQSFEKSQTEEYECLVLGNSRIYRGINPDMFDVPCFNFAHDNDSINQCYYKLIFLEKNHVSIDIVVLGIDYFEFSVMADTRNYVYNRYFEREYQEDYKKIGVFRWVDEERIMMSIRRTFQDSTPILLNYLRGVELQEGQIVPYLKSNGQYISQPTRTASQEDDANRNISRIPIQVSYFEKIIEFCENKGIQLIILMPPVRENELIKYTPEEIDEFNMFIDKYTEANKIVYYNLSEAEGFDDILDFMDFTHLNQAGSEKFSLMVNEIVNFEKSNYKR